MDDRRQEYDPALLLTRVGLGFVAMLMLFVSIIIVLQIIYSADHSANTESWAAMTGLIGWATSQVSVIFSNRYGTTKQASSKDEVIAQQSRTAAALATGGTAQTGTPIVTENLAVASQNTVVTKEAPDGPT